MEFAVKVKGTEGEGGHWVLALDMERDRVLIAHPDRSLHWHPLAECAFFGAHTPDQPSRITVVQPKDATPAQPVIVKPNIVMPRHNGLS